MSARILLSAALILAFAVGSAPARTPGTINRILVAPDTSGSLDQTEYRATCEAVAEIAAQLSRSGQISEIALLPWAYTADCKASPVWRSELPARAEIPESQPHLTEAAQIFRRYQDQQRESSARREREGKTQRDRDYGRLVEPLLQEFHQKLLACRQGRARCTAVDALLKRCSQESPSTLCIVITDGLEECDRLAEHSLSAGARTVVVLVPTNSGSDPDRDLIERRIRERAPWALIVPSFRLTDSTINWSDLLLGPEWSTAPSVEATAVRLGGGTR